MDVNDPYFTPYKIYRSILIIDIKSFYASCECLMRGLDIFKTPLVVADAERGGGSVVLSVTPFMKARGVHNVCRIFELPKNLDIVFAKPRMGQYLKYSQKIVNLYLQYVSEKDIHVYSVDEVFLDVTTYLQYYGMTAVELGMKIQKHLKDELGFVSACGVGCNMLLAKLAMDIEAKKTKDGIAEWTYDSIPQKLWPITDLTKMWSIGERTAIKLRAMGVEKLGDAANNFSYQHYANKYGIIGGELWHHLHGIDMSLIGAKPNVVPKSRSLGNSQVFFRDYYGDEIKTIIHEMTEVVGWRLRAAHYQTRVIHFGLMYNSKCGKPGFGRQMTLPVVTSSERVIYEVCEEIFKKYYDGSPVRRIGISLGGLTPECEPALSLFSQPVDKEILLLNSLDEIRAKYGHRIIGRASALMEHSTMRARQEMIGGHHE